MKKTIDYKKAYNTYKKLPNIALIFTIILATIFGVIDAIVWLTALDLFALLVWPAVGVLLGFIVRFFLTLGVSPTVLRTDATLEICNSLKNEKGEFSEL